MSKLKVAIVFSIAGQYATQILSFATIVVLARILTPAEIGVFAVASAVTLIATEMRSLGAGQYLVRERDISEDKIRAVLGVTVTVSWLLGLILILSAPAVSRFYNEPPLKGILWILSVTFFAGPFTSVPLALWRRNLQFQPMFIRMVVGVFVAGVSSIGLVLLGFSYYGLACGFTLGLLAELLVAIILRPAGTVWVPHFKWIGDLIRFGLFSSTTNLFNRFSEGIPDLVIGRFATMADVGQFSRGLGAVLFLNRLLERAVSPVVLPHLAQVHRDGKSVSDAYIQSVNLLLSVSWPFMAVASAAAYPMINFLFGDQWDAAVAITSIVAIWAMLIGTQTFSNSALIVTGSERIMFFVGFFCYVVRMTVVIAAAPQGIKTVAWAMVGAGVVEAFTSTLALRTAISLDLKKLALILMPNLAIAAICYGATIGIDYLIDFRETPPIVSIATIALVVTPLWLLLLRITKHESWGFLVGMFESARQKLFANKSTPYS